MCIHEPQVGALQISVIIKMGSFARAMRRGGLAVINSDHHALPTAPLNSYNLQWSR